MNTVNPKSEIDFIKSIVERTNRRVDAQAFHVVHWGLIVLIWYPLANWLQDAGRAGESIWLGIGAILLGFLLSFVRGARAAGRVRGENTFIGKQVVLITIGCIGAGMVLSGVLPNTILHGRHVPILWGLVYANLAFMMGVVTNRDFLIAGVAIFAGSIVAMFLDDWSGYILGPVMGLGMVVPGLRAEARVRELLRQQAGAAA